MDKKMLISIQAILLLSACTRSMETAPVQPPATTVTPTLSFTNQIPSTSTPEFTSMLPVPDIYAVINVPEGETLNIRSGAGVENSIVGELQPDQSGLMRTGQAVNRGEELWIEIQNPSGGTGWVNADYLTEYVHPLAFCGDMRVKTLLQAFEVAVTTSDGELLKSLVSPAHGVDISFIRLGMLANYSPEEANWAFQSTYVVDWGVAAGSGAPVTGTFPQIILPALQDVFKNDSITCNEIKLGGATYEVKWPEEYVNINFYSVHNPGNDPSYGGMDWLTWLVGVEYVNGNPYLFSLTHYQWEP